MELISIPRKAFSSSIDPNKNHGSHCVVVMVDALNDEEAIQTAKSRFDELPKFVLRLPSEVSKHEELEAFFSMENQKRNEMSFQADRRMTEGVVSCQTKDIDGDESHVNIQMRNTAKHDEPVQPISAAPTPVKRPRQSYSGDEQVVKKQAVDSVNDEMKKEEEQIEDPLLKNEQNSVADGTVNSFHTSKDDPGKDGGMQISRTSDSASIKSENCANEEEMEVDSPNSIPKDTPLSIGQIPLSRKSLKPALASTFHKEESVEGEADMKVLKCTSCSAHIAKRKTGSFSFKLHALSHCEERRFKCNICPYTAYLKLDVARHSTRYHDGASENPIDQKNVLREALWKYWMYKCFPGVDELVTFKLPKRVTIEKCGRCSKEVMGDEVELFYHIITEHPEEKLDYDDPEGVKKRFFPDEE